MPAYIIPLINQPQTLSISLNSKTYMLNVYWNNWSNNWNIDFADSLNNKILSGVPLLSNIDLFEQYGYLGFSGKLICSTDNAMDVNPTFGNLGVSSHLYFETLT